MYDKNWAKVDVHAVPHFVAPPPGPKSQEVHPRAARYMKGYSSQVRLFPGGFRVGQGLHAHSRGRQRPHRLLVRHLRHRLGSLPPKVTEAVQRRPAS